MTQIITNTFRCLLITIILCATCHTATATNEPGIAQVTNVPPSAAELTNSVAKLELPTHTNNRTNITLTLSSPVSTPTQNLPQIDTYHAPTIKNSQPNSSPTQPQTSETKTDKTWFAMDTDTFRYLMSALMQVFGALVALDAIFLVFQQQAMGSFKTKLLQQIGRQVSLINRFNGFSFTTRPEIAPETERDADVFETFKFEDIFREVESAKNAIDSKIDKEQQEMLKALAQAAAHPTAFGHAQKASKHENNLREANRTATLLHHCFWQYNTIRRREDAIPKQVTATMAVPAGLVIIFSLALAPAGPASETYNMYAAITAIALSAIALGYLVLTARAIMVGPKDQPKTGKSIPAQPSATPNPSSP